MAIFNLRHRLAALSAWALALALAFGAALPQPAQAIGPETGYAQMQGRDFRSLRVGVPAGIGASRTPVSIPRASVPANLPRIPAAPPAGTMSAASGRSNSCITCGAVVSHSNEEARQGVKSRDEIVWRDTGSLIGGATAGVGFGVLTGALGGGPVLGAWVGTVSVVPGAEFGGAFFGTLGMIGHHQLDHHRLTGGGLPGFGGGLQDF